MIYSTNSLKRLISSIVELNGFPIEVSSAHLENKPAMAITVTYKNRSYTLERSYDRPELDNLTGRIANWIKQINLDEAFEKEILLEASSKV